MLNCEKKEKKKNVKIFHKLTNSQSKKNKLRFI